MRWLKNKKNIFFLIVMVAILTIIIFSFFYFRNYLGNMNKEDDSLKRVMGTGVLNAGVSLTAGFTGAYINQETDEWEGYFADVTKEIASKMGIDVNFIEVDFDEIQSKLDSRVIDCFVSDYFVTEERKETMSFTQPLLYGHTVLAVNFSIKSTDLSVLEGGTIGYLNKSASYDLVLKSKTYKKYLKYISFRSYDDAVYMMNDLQNLGIEGVLADELFLEKQVEQGVCKFFVDENGNNIMTDDASAYAIALQQKSYQLGNMINKYISDLRNSGKLSELSIKYYERDLTKNQTTTSSA